MKRRTLLAILAILALVTLACGLTGGSTDEEAPEAAQPPAESGGEQPTSESGGEQPTSESGGEQPTSAPESGGGAPEIAGLDALNSYRLHMTWRGENEDGSESYEMNILEEWVKEPPTRHLAMSTSVAGSEERPVLEMIRVGDTTWIKMGETWIQSESPDESAMGEGLSNAWEGSLAGDLEGWVLVGEETVNGVHCKHYATDDETTITVPDPQGGGTVTTHVQGETWVADQPGLPPVTVRERSQMEGGFFPMPLAGGEAAGETGTVHWEFDVTDINAPITIEPPGEASEMPSLPSVGETPTSPPEAAAPPEPAAANTTVRPSDGMEMILIPAGEFLMGTDESPFAHERPAHLVTLDEYWMDRTEMTNGRYRLCVEAGVCAEPKSWEDSNLNGDDQPTLVPWEAAQAYCGWVGERLPTPHRLRLTVLAGSNIRPGCISAHERRPNLREGSLNSCLDDIEPIVGGVTT